MHTFSPGAAAGSCTSLYTLCKSWTEREIEGKWIEMNFTQTPAHHYSIFGKVTKLRGLRRKEKSVAFVHVWPTRWKFVPHQTKLFLFASINIRMKGTAFLRICQPTITFTYLRTYIHAHIHIEPDTLFLVNNHKLVLDCLKLYQLHSEHFSLSFRKITEKNVELFKNYVQMLYKQYSFHICKVIKITCYFIAVWVIFSLRKAVLLTYYVYRQLCDWKPFCSKTWGFICQVWQLWCSLTVNISVWKGVYKIMNCRK